MKLDRRPRINSDGKFSEHSSSLYDPKIPQVPSLLAPTGNTNSLVVLEACYSSRACNFLSCALFIIAFLCYVLGLLSSRLARNVTQVPIGDVSSHTSERDRERERKRASQPDIVAKFTWHSIVSARSPQVSEEGVDTRLLTSTYPDRRITNQCCTQWLKQIVIRYSQE
jgi:hypothetical protein